MCSSHFDLYSDKQTMDVWANGKPVETTVGLEYGSVWISIDCRANSAMKAPRRTFRSMEWHARYTVGVLYLASSEVYYLLENQIFLHCMIYRAVLSKSKQRESITKWEIDYPLPSPCRLYRSTRANEVRESCMSFMWVATTSRVIPSRLHSPNSQPNLLIQTR